MSTVHAHNVSLAAQPTQTNNVAAVTSSESQPAGAPAAPPVDPAADVDTLRSQLSSLLLADAERHAKRLRGINKVKKAGKRHSILASIANDVDADLTRANERNARLPTVSYPAELPITERRAEIIDTIRDHQVVIVAGETGSGKSTQLPKLCLEAGLGRRGFIGHTQPRRIAARSIAERVAEEIGSDVGDLVGWTVRFNDNISNNTFVRCMTDGILLAEIQRDRRLLRYDTLIIDEAHERSLNIDFLLGYLHQLRRRRPDLKIVITSATIDTEKFSAHFDDAPVIEVSGRSYPVDIRYEPPDEGDDLADAIAGAVESLTREGPGDILVFNSGERQINDAADAIRKRHLPHTEVLPLYARLSAAEQHRVFEPHSGRRVVLATNVAETSLTVPGIRYVVDPGLARISRYSMRTKVQRLPIEAISQASANQRSGRCGRLGPGICVRLYEQEDFENRPDFTEPEIRRTNLASVILQMANLDLGAPDEFPFVDPPEARSLRDGVALLDELGAIDAQGRPGTRSWLTPTGKLLARLPVDPRLGRMVIEADRNGCLHEVAVIAAGLSVQDPRERPANKRDAADELHARYADPDSDFLSLLALWDWIGEERANKSSNQFRRQCKREYLHWLRIREWQDIHRQIMRTCDDLGFKRTSVGHDYETITRSLLAGLLSNLGIRDGESREYRGARNSRFVLAPGSSLSSKGPAWVLAGELVETNRLWGRMLSRVRPEWAEELGDHLVERSYGDPLWDIDRGTAVVDERVSLYGLPIVNKRRVDYRRIDHEMARSMFIHHALIERDWADGHAFLDQPFFANNSTVLEELRELEARARRRDLFAEYDGQYRFYDTRVPPEVTSGQTFDRWWREVRKDQPHRLDMSIDDFIEPEAAQVEDDAFPTEWHSGDASFPLRYVFDHDQPDDGVTVTVPAALLASLDADRLDWNVPGFHDEVVTGLVRGLPKDLRRLFVPVPDTVARLMLAIDPTTAPLVSSVRRELGVIAGMHLPPDALSIDRLPDHLRLRIEVTGDDDEVVAVGRSLSVLRAELQTQVRAAITGGRHPLERSGVTQWDFGELPRRLETDAQGHIVEAWPALIDAGDSVAIRLLPTRAEQRRAMRRGTRRLLRLTTGAPIKVLKPRLTNDTRLAIALSPHGSIERWVEDCVWCGLDAAVDAAGGVAWNATDFDRLQHTVRDEMPELLEEIGKHASWISVSNAEVVRLLDRLEGQVPADALRDAKEHLDRLVYDWHLSGVGAERLLDVDRYVRAIAHRLERLRERERRDHDLMMTCRSLEARFWQRADAQVWSTDLEDVAWMLEELRVSLFAESIGAKQKVSPARVQRAIESL